MNSPEPSWAAGRCRCSINTRAERRSASATTSSMGIWTTSSAGDQRSPDHWFTPPRHGGFRNRSAKQLASNIRYIPLRHNESANRISGRRLPEGIPDDGTDELQIPRGDFQRGDPQPVRSEHRSDGARGAPSPARIRRILAVGAQDRLLGANGNPLADARAQIGAPTVGAGCKQGELPALIETLAWEASPRRRLWMYTVLICAFTRSISMFGIKNRACDSIQVSSDSI